MQKEKGGAAEERKRERGNWGGYLTETPIIYLAIHVHIGTAQIHGYINNTISKIIL